MNRNESKYFRTAQKMDDALISLLEKKDFEFITVKEICQTAGVNRSTFYLHYENTTDLLRETTQYILDKHFSYYSADLQSISQFPQTDRSTSIFITPEYLKPYLTFVKENQRLFRLALKHFHLLNMNHVHDMLFQNIFQPILSQFHIPSGDQQYVIKFYLSGIMGIVTEWLSHECAEDMDRVIRIITDCILGPRSIDE